MITIFNSIFRTDTPFHVDIEYALDLIKSGKNKDLIDQIRAEKDKTKRNELKKKLKGICFSGKFSKRSDNSIIEHSGYACIDYDDVKDPESLKSDLMDTGKVYACFVSPSGKGVKALIKIPAVINDHKLHYQSIIDALSFEGVDESTQDLSRVCYESYDPNLLINEDAEVWTDKVEFEIVKKDEKVPEFFQITDKKLKLEIMLKWFDKNYKFIKGQMNNNLCKLAAALNKVGIDKIEAKIIVMSRYPDMDLGEKKINEIFEWAYKKESDFDSFVVKDHNKIADASTWDEKKLKQKMFDEGYSNDDIEEISEFDFKSINLDFWDYNSKGTPVIQNFMFRKFLEKNGFYRLNLNDQEYTFIHRIDNVIVDLVGVNRDYIKDYVLKYLVDNKYMDVYQVISGNPKYFKEEFLNQISKIDLQVLMDDQNTSYFYFKNGCVKVTADKTEILDYIDCGGLVWKNQIMQKEFTELTDYKGCDFEKFISNVTNEDPVRKDALERSIGYLLHRYKKKTEAYAVILYDETNSENPEGGTGKTLLMDAVGEIRSLGWDNGKNFTTKGDFPYQNINQSHDVFCIDDLNKKFDFEGLFAMITRSMPINKKGKQPIVIPFEESPKMCLTSNYILRGEGKSHERRKVEIELYKYYTSNHTPADEAGRMFFSGWDNKEYNRFYNYMIGCLRKFLKKGIKKLPLISGLERKLIDSTNDSFFAWMERDVIWVEDKKYNSGDLLKIFSKDENNEVPPWLNPRAFSRWIKLYLDYKGWVKDDAGRDDQSRRLFSVNFQGNPPDNSDLLPKKEVDIFEEDENELF